MGPATTLPSTVGNTSTPLVRRCGPAAGSCRAGRRTARRKPGTLPSRVDRDESSPARRAIASASSPAQLTATEQRMVTPESDPIVNPSPSASIDSTRTPVRNSAPWRRASAASASVYTTGSVTASPGISSAPSSRSTTCTPFRARTANRRDGRALRLVERPHHRPAAQHRNGERASSGSRALPRRGSTRSRAHPRQHRTQYARCPNLCRWRRARAPARPRAERPQRVSARAPAPPRSRPRRRRSPRPRRPLSGPLTLRAQAYRHAIPKV